MQCQEVLYYENFDLTTIKMPVRVQILESLLKQAKYDEDKTKKLIDGFTRGFKIGYQGNRKLKRLAPNFPLTVGSKTDLWNKVMKEVEKQHFAGPFSEVPFEYYIQSPIDLVDKDHGKDTRLIFHLSYPHSGKSVNSETPDEMCGVKYPDFSYAIRLCLELTKNAKDKRVYSGKSDMKSAFRNLPILVSDFMLLVMKAENPLYGKIYFFMDKCLPFGASISCAIF